MSLAVESRVVLTCELTDAEQDLAAVLLQLSGCGSEANLCRLALWHLAKHYDVPVGDHFGQRTRGSAVRGRKYRQQPSRLRQRELTTEEIA